MNGLTFRLRANRSIYGWAELDAEHRQEKMRRRARKTRGLRTAEEWPVRFGATADTSECERFQLLLRLRFGFSGKPRAGD
jgi:hypothetical protein